MTSPAARSLAAAWCKLRPQVRDRVIEHAGQQFEGLFDALVGEVEGAPVDEQWAVIFHDHLNGPAIKLCATREVAEQQLRGYGDWRRFDNPRVVWRTVGPGQWKCTHGLTSMDPCGLCRGIAQRLPLPASGEARPADEED